MSTTRREFLRQSALTTLGLGIAVPRIARAALPRAPVAAGDTVVVALFLDGGNDALNTIVPLDQVDRYREYRRRVGIDIERLIPLPGHADDFGVNPACAALVDLFAAGKVAIVNGVGPPVNALGLFNHEASRSIFITSAVEGHTGAGPLTGWLGRAADRLTRDDLPLAVGIGHGGGAIITGAVEKPLVLPSIASFRIEGGGEGAARIAAYRRIQAAAGGLPPAAEHHRLLRLEVLEFSETLQQLAAAHRAVSTTSYPRTLLGGAMRDAAALVAADRGTRCIAVSISGFDTHGQQNQRAGPDDPFGFHEILLHDVSESVAAFTADLESVGGAERTVVLILSEFGRRVPDNPSLGTDHGFGSMMFAVGAPVRGGIYGDYPSLDDLVLGGNLAAPIDFRSVYATLLADHLDLDPVPILGGAFPRVRFLG